ncbi:MAG: DUF418 domain-containing protein, partial [Acidobacteria bacterium]|nr:DUF418 domain-containing protein [Acidobacteriota bacterium]
MTSSPESANIPAPTSVESERLHVLDILRGFAILGMFPVHFITSFFFRGESRSATDGGAIGVVIFQVVVEWFVHNKGWAIFTILFGVGFAMQLRRADTHGEDARWRYLRRLLGVSGFGMVTAALVGATDLIGYVTSGLWLFIVRRWSTRALVVLLLATIALGGLINVAVGTYQWATVGVESANTVYQSPRPVSPAKQAANEETSAARQGTSFARLASAHVVSRVFYRVTDLWGDWERGIPGTLLGSLIFNLPFFLIGFLAFRLGVFERPAQHRRLLISAMLVGAALWAIDTWNLHESLWAWLPALPVVQVARPLHNGFGLVNGMFLALTYVGAIALLVARSKVWEHRLAAIFGAAGRLALTNYIVHFAVLSVLIYPYGFGVKFTPQSGAGAAVILFAALAVFSRWWLARFRLG